MSDLLRASGVDSFDGPIRIRAHYGELTKADVSGFVDTRLLAEDRRLPIIAARGVPPIDLAASRSTGSPAASTSPARATCVRQPDRDIWPSECGYGNP
ncbi:MAG: hypothetical protein M3417_03350 [Actinomycetota bacterium]|nr:hypothetical protein [Actinomycetota bacterium]